VRRDDGHVEPLLVASQIEKGSEWLLQRHRNWQRRIVSIVS
jgi:hypothetical protein